MLLFSYLVFFVCFLEKSLRMNADSFYKSENHDGFACLCIELDTIETKEQRWRQSLELLYKVWLNMELRAGL